MAAELMRLKSKMLLPPDEVAPEEEGEEPDPRAELIHRLLEYESFKRAAGRLGEIESSQALIYPRAGGRPSPEEYAVEPVIEASLFDLLTALTRVLKTVPREDVREILKDPFTVEEQMHGILHRLRAQPSIPFGVLFKEPGNRLEIVTTFLALLELIRLREVTVVQRERFGEMWISRNPGHIEAVLGP